MIRSIKTEHLPLSDLVTSTIIIVVMSTVLANIYNAMWGVIYALGNLITLTFLGWLYKETWSVDNK